MVNMVHTCSYSTRNSVVRGAWPAWPSIRWEDHFGLTVTFTDPKEASTRCPEDSQIVEETMKLKKGTHRVGPFLDIFSINLSWHVISIKFYKYMICRYDFYNTHGISNRVPTCFSADGNHPVKSSVSSDCFIWVKSRPIPRWRKTYVTHMYVYVWYIYIYIHTYIYRYTHL